MNSIEVKGGSKKEREVAQEAISWCVKRLLPRLRTLDIEAKFSKISAYGYCSEGDSNREFDLEFKKGMSLFDLISTICHEMVHVKQYAKGEMKFDHYSGRTKWKAKLISDNVEYENQPWEKEAFKMEENLAIECFKAIKVTL
jgi:phosphoketolase